METAISSQNGWLLLGVYGVVMTLLVWFGTKREKTAEQHLVADRNVGVWAGAFSIAATWIWAPAIFVCSQKSFEQGLAGIFWFTVPNIICFFTFAAFAFKARAMMPNSYSLPDLIWKRFNGDPRSHQLFLLIALGISITGIINNSLAGGLLLHSIAGTDQNSTIIAFSVIALCYSAWRGLPASVITDVIQMGLILLIALVLVPWTLFNAGGFEAITGGLSGIQGSINVLDPWILYSFGIPATIGLISGPICDQMFYQRAMATKPESIKKTFIYGGLIFGIVPVVLSLFGFIAANPEFSSVIGAGDSQLVSVRVVEHFLPAWTLLGFAVMALCGLSSTLDSAYCAAGSLFSVDVYKRYMNPNANDHQMLNASKAGMFFIGLVGTGIAILPGVKLLWIFMIYGTMAAAVVFPAILSVYWKQVTAQAVTWGVFVALIVGLPTSIYANVSESPHVQVFSSVSTTLIGFFVTYFVTKFSTQTKVPVLETEGSAA